MFFFKKTPIIFILLISMAASQTISPQVTDTKKRLLVLSSKQGDSENDIGQTISKIVAEVATSLGRYEVIDRNQLETILDELALHQAGLIDEKDILELGGIASAKEAMNVDVIHFSQKGVPPKKDKEKDDDDDKSFWETVAIEMVKGAIRSATKHREDEPYPYNIETIIHANIILLDVETGKTLENFPISTTYTGGSSGESLIKALRMVRWNVSRALQELYTITSEVLAVDGSHVTLYLGSDMGIRKGTIYGISRLDKKKSLRDREIIIPGSSVGLVRLDKVSGDASVGTVVRKWGRVKIGYKATEMIHPPKAAAGIYVTYNQKRRGLDRGGVSLQLNPFGRWAFNGYFGGGTIMDSRRHKDGMFTMGGGMVYRFLYTPKFNLNMIIDLPLNFVFRRDDANHDVITLFISPLLGIQTEIMINRRMDMVFQGGISGPGVHGTWQYSEGEGDKAKTYDGEWDKNTGAPTLDGSGLYFNISLRFMRIN